MKTKTALLAGLAGGLIAAVGFAGAATAASPGTVAPSSGPAAGGTQTTLNVPGLANAFQGTTDGYFALGADGNIYQGNNGGVKVNAPAGVTFTAFSSAMSSASGGIRLSAVSSDGDYYYSQTPGAGVPLAKVTLPTKVIATANGDFALGADGNVYQANAGGAKVNAPAGVTFTSISAYHNDSVNMDVLSAISSTGDYYFVAGPGGGAPLAKVTLPTTAVATSDGYFALGADGNIYQGNNGGVKVNAPAGVTFTSFSSALSSATGGIRLGAVSSDGDYYYAQAPGTGVPLAKVTIPTKVIATAGGDFALGEDGNIYQANNGGAKVNAPAGVTFTSISAYHNDSVDMDVLSAISSTGDYYFVAGPGGAPLAKVDVPVTLPTVTGVSFGGSAATALSQPATTTVAATTPSHATGPVDVVVTTKNAAGNPGPSFTIPNGFTYLAPASAVSITLPADSSTVDNNSNAVVDVKGVGTPGASVTLKDETGATLGTTTVDANGNWTINVPGSSITDGPHTWTASQDDNGTVTSDSINIQATNLGGPIADPLVAGGVLMLALAGTGVWMTVRRKRQQLV